MTWKNPYLKQLLSKVSTVLIKSHKGREVIEKSIKYHNVLCGQKVRPVLHRAHLTRQLSKQTLRGRWLCNESSASSLLSCLMQSAVQTSQDTAELRLFLLATNSTESVRKCFGSMWIVSGSVMNASSPAACEQKL